MKRLGFLVSCIILLLNCVGCGSDEAVAEVKSGGYFLEGNYEELVTPYLWVNTENQTFHMGAGAIFSYAEVGEYEIEGSKLIATSQNTTFVFEIKDENTLILVDNGDSKFFSPPINGEYRYSEDIQ